MAELALEKSVRTSSCVSSAGRSALGGRKLHTRYATGSAEPVFNRLRPTTRFHPRHRCACLRAS